MTTLEAVISTGFYRENRFKGCAVSLLNWPSLNGYCNYLSDRINTMVSIKQRRIVPVPSGHRTFNELQDVSAFLDKRNIIPADAKLKQSQSSKHNKPQRKGQLIDLLV